jgi:hypothetical protein
VQFHEHNISVRGLMCVCMCIYIYIYVCVCVCLRNFSCGRLMEGVVNGLLFVMVFLLSVIYCLGICVSPLHYMESSGCTGSLVKQSRVYKAICCT